MLKKLHANLIAAIKDNQQKLITQAMQTIDVLQKQQSKIPDLNFKLWDKEFWNYIDKEGYTLLQTAIIANNQDLIGFLINQPDVDINKVTEIKIEEQKIAKSALIIAWEMSDNKTIVKLIGKGIDDKNDDIWVRLAKFAIEKSDQELTTLLIKQGLTFNQIWELDAETEKKQASLFAQHGLKFDRRLDGIGKPENASFLHYTMKYGNEEFLKFLFANFKNSINVDIKDPLGYTPLLLAVIHNKTAMAKILLANNANINAQDDDKGWTVLIHAITRNNNELTDLIFSHKPELAVSAKDYRRFHPLHFAIEANNHLATQKLITAKVNINEPASTVTFNSTIKNITPLMLAAQLKHNELMKLLLAAEGININATAVEKIDLPAWTALSLAAVYLNFEGTKLLLNAGTSMQAISNNVLKEMFSYIKLCEDIIEAKELKLVNKKEYYAYSDKIPLEIDNAINAIRLLIANDSKLLETITTNTKNPSKHLEKKIQSFFDSCNTFHNSLLKLLEKHSVKLESSLIPSDYQLSNDLQQQENFIRGQLKLSLLLDPLIFSYSFENFLNNRFPQPLRLDNILKSLPLETRENINYEFIHHVDMLIDQTLNSDFTTSDNRKMILQIYADFYQHLFHSSLLNKIYTLAKESENKIKNSQISTIEICLKNAILFVPEIFIATVKKFLNATEYSLSTLKKLDSDHLAQIKTNLISFIDDAAISIAKDSLIDDATKSLVSEFYQHYCLIVGDILHKQVSDQLMIEEKTEENKEEKIKPPERITQINADQIYYYCQINRDKNPDIMRLLLIWLAKDFMSEKTEINAALELAKLESLTSENFKNLEKYLLEISQSMPCWITESFWGLAPEKCSILDTILLHFVLHEIKAKNYSSFDFLAKILLANDDYLQNVLTEWQSYTDNLATGDNSLKSDDIKADLNKNNKLATDVNSILTLLTTVKKDNHSYYNSIINSCIHRLKQVESQLENLISHLSDYCSKITTTNAPAAFFYHEAKPPLSASELKEAEIEKTETVATGNNNSNN